MRSARRWWLLALVLLVSTGVLSACLKSSEIQTPAAIKQPAAAFVLDDVSGKMVKFPEDFQGKKVLLVFFSTG